MSSGVMLSGVGAPDADAALGTGDDSLITDIKDGFGGDASAIPGGIDSGGAPDESTGGIGGAASNGGGAAGAGGSGGKGTAHAGSSAGGTSGAGHGGASAAGSANTPPPTLYFSEYVEGSSAYKALEIAAQKRSVLDGCKVGTYFNGKTEATVVATLSGVLEAGQVLTLCSSALQEKLGARCKQVGNLTFNGDDVVAVSCDGKILDAIGQVGVDPGTGWGSAANSTLDHTLRRKCTVTSGDAIETNAFDPSGEWSAFPVDTFDGLGTRGC
ncbi:MAG: hypothetical protein ABUL62_13060 [Myxococcales bacterium]